MRSAGLLASGGDDGLEQLLSIDSTVVRAHQHAAGARKIATQEDAAQPSGDTGGNVEITCTCRSSRLIEHWAVPAEV